jgi:hypothetical protein
MGAEAERLIVPSLGQIICLINASVAMEHYCIRSGDLSLQSMESYSVGEHRYITLELTMELFNGMEILSPELAIKRYCIRSGDLSLRS